MTVTILTGDCRDVLRTLADESVHCVVTSPPYWGLRDYGIPPLIWGGDPACEHEWGDPNRTAWANSVPGPSPNCPKNGGGYSCDTKFTGPFCSRCRAWRGAHGLEPDYQLFVEHEVMIFREVRRVLRADGTLWLNLGDSYATGAGKVGNAPGGGEQGERWKGGPPSDKSTLKGNGHVGGGPKLKALAPIPGHRGQHTAEHSGKHAPRIEAMGPMTQPNRMPQAGLKAKDLCGIPWRVAFALQADGWYLRQDIIWCLSGGAWLYARTPAKIGPMMLKDLTRLAPRTVELWNGERWTRVTAWTKRQGRSDAVEIVLRSGERIGCTNNHVWPTQRGNVRADELQIGDVIRSTLLPDGERQQGWIADEAFWFAGLYLAEGSRSGETIQISGHTREAEERLRRVRALVSHYGGSARAYTTGNAHNIHIDSIGISAVLRSLIAGKTAKDKRLSPSAWHYPNWQLRQIVEGYLHGDGHLDEDRVRLGFCRNYDLERDLRCLAARLGATLTLKPTVAKNQSGSFPSFKGEWRWSRSGHHNERDRSEIVEIRNSRARQFWDVTVADDPHLFALALGVLTHNSKPNPMPESVRDRCTKAHEYLFLLSKSERYFYDADAIKEDSITNDPRRPYTSEGAWQMDGRPAEQRQGGKPRTAGNKSHKYVDAYDASETEEHRTKAGLMKVADVPWERRNRRSVWEVATAPYSDAHFATFPPALIEPCIKAGCPQGGTVLDPFFGAGTTGLVADRLGHNCIGIELNDAYAEMAERRIKGDAGMFAKVQSGNIEDATTETIGLRGI